MYISIIVSCTRFAIYTTKVSLFVSSTIVTNKFFLIISTFLVVDKFLPAMLILQTNFCSANSIFALLRMRKSISRTTFKLILANKKIF